MEHLALVVGVQNPVVGAKIELSGVGNFLVVPDLNLGSVGPVFDYRTEVDVVVDSIVVKLFFLDLVNRVSECLIDPVKDVKHFHAHYQQLVIWHSSRYNVHSQ